MQKKKFENYLQVHIRKNKKIKIKLEPEYVYILMKVHLKNISCF